MEGKLTDVLIEDSTAGIVVWADPGMKDTISSVPGLSWCNDREPTKYEVHLDPRYDIEWVKQEIIARVKIGTEEET